MMESGDARRSVATRNKMNIWLVFVIASMWFSCTTAKTIGSPKEMDVDYACIVENCTGTECSLIIVDPRGRSDVEAVTLTFAGLALSAAVIAAYGSAACFFELYDARKRMAKIKP